MSAVRNEYEEYEYYGSSSSEEHGTCFKVKGIMATFSVHTQDGTLCEAYDVQVEGIPPGDYVYTCIASLPELVELISKYKQAETKWP